MIGFVGLSHLGIVSSIATASKGFQVAAYDPDSNLCDTLAKSQLPIAEPGLSELLESSRDQIGFSSDPSFLNRCEVVYISKDAPTEDDGASDLTAIQNLIDAICPHLAPDACLVLLSQVPPGFNRRLSKSLGSRSGASNISLFHQVETLIFGQAVDRALNPERIIVGCSSTNQPIPQAYSSLLDSFDCPVLTMSYQSAELTKAALNVFLAASVTASNTLAEICEKIGADWNEIVPALRSDRRIGPYAYLAPGLGLSGGNLERDLATIGAISSEYGTDSGVIDAYLTNSQHRQSWALKTLCANSPAGSDGSTVAVWGLTYKPDTNSTKNSPALSLINGLGNTKVRAYDPKAVLEPQTFSNIDQTETALDCCHGADALAIMTAWKEFSAVDLDQVREMMAGRVIVDPLGLLEREKCAALGFQLHQLGSPNVQEYASW
jgi:UDPglucose 6-dehydrogenase